MGKANQSYLQEGVAILELANRAAELKQKKAAGVVFDDLHQLEYTRREKNPSRNPSVSA